MQTALGRVAASGVVKERTVVSIAVNQSAAFECNSKEPDSQCSHDVTTEAAYTQSNLLCVEYKVEGVLWGDELKDKIEDELRNRINATGKILCALTQANQPNVSSDISSSSEHGAAGKSSWVRWYRAHGTYNSEPSKRAITRRDRCKDRWHQLEAIVRYRVQAAESDGRLTGEAGEQRATSDKMCDQRASTTGSLSNARQWWKSTNDGQTDGNDSDVSTGEHDCIDRQCNALTEEKEQSAIR